MDNEVTKENLQLINYGIVSKKFLETLKNVSSLFVLYDDNVKVKDAQLGNLLERHKLEISITKFKKLKEKIIRKESIDNSNYNLHFDLDNNKDFIWNMIFLREYANKNYDLDTDNDIKKKSTFVFLNGSTYDENIHNSVEFNTLKESVAFFQKLRDALSHNENNSIYNYDQSDNMLKINNTYFKSKLKCDLPLDYVADIWNKITPKEDDKDIESITNAKTNNIYNQLGYSKNESKKKYSLNEIFRTNDPENIVLIAQVCHFFSNFDIEDQNLDYTYLDTTKFNIKYDDKNLELQKQAEKFIENILKIGTKGKFSFEDISNLYNTLIKSSGNAKIANIITAPKKSLENLKKGAELGKKTTLRMSEMHKHIVKSIRNSSEHLRISVSPNDPNLIVFEDYNHKVTGKENFFEASISKDDLKVFLNNLKTLETIKSLPMPTNWTDIFNQMLKFSKNSLTSNYKYEIQEDKFIINNNGNLIEYELPEGKNIIDEKINKFDIAFKITDKVQELQDEGLIEDLDIKDNNLIYTQNEVENTIKIR